MRCLWMVALAVGLVGCHDFEDALASCVDAGACEPGASGGGAGTGGATATGGGAGTGGATATGGGAGTGGAVATGGGTGGETGTGGSAGTGGGATGGGQGGGTGGAPSARLVLTPSSADLADVAVGDSLPTNFQVQNVGDAAAAGLALSLLPHAGAGLFQAYSLGLGCGPGPLAPGSSCVQTVAFRPTLVGDAGADLVASLPDGGLAVAAFLSGQGVPVLSTAPAASAGAISLGQVNVGNSAAPRTVVVTNASRTSRSLGVVATPPFMAQVGTCTSVPARGSCSLSVGFSPTTQGAGQNGTLTVSTGAASEDVVLSLLGDGLAPAALSITPNTFDFPQLDVGARASASFTLTNGAATQATGPVALSITPDAGFALDAGTCVLGSPLAGGNSCTFGVEFSPRAYGTHGATVAASAAPGGVFAANLTGRGMDYPAVTLSVTGPGFINSAGSACRSACTLNPAHDSTLVLTAAPDANYRLVQWTGACAGVTGATCSLTVSGPLSVGAIFGGQPQTLTVAVSPAGAGHVSGTGLTDCVGSCTVANLTFGDSVTYTATPGADAIFTGWSGCPSGATTGPCAFTMPASFTLTANFSRYNYAFLTADALTALNSGGVASADQACNNYARDAGVPGTFVALISSSTQSSLSRLGSARGWIRLDGKPYLDLPGDLLAGRIRYPLVLDARGQQVGGSLTIPTVATGTSAGGAAAETCSNWTALGSTVATYFQGEANSLGLRAISADKVSCAGLASGTRFYCLGLDHTTPLPQAVIPPLGRRAFVSRTQVDGTVGPAGNAIDTLCQNEASDAGLPGQYAAFRANTASVACAGFSLDGGAWYRTDGVRLFQDNSALCQSTGTLAWDSPPSRQADGSPVGIVDAGTVVWTGSPYPGALAATTFNNQRTCDNWAASPQQDWSGIVGNAADARNLFADGVAQTCDNSFRVYCFQK